MLAKNCLYKIIGSDQNSRVFCLFGRMVSPVIILDSCLQILSCGFVFQRPVITLAYQGEILVLVICVVSPNSSRMGGWMVSGVNTIIPTFVVKSKVDTLRWIINAVYKSIRHSWSVAFTKYRFLFFRAMILEILVLEAQLLVSSPTIIKGFPKIRYRPYIL